MSATPLLASRLDLAGRWGFSDSLPDYFTDTPSIINDFFEESPLLNTPFA
jgi:hypothetical protein